MSVGRAVRYIYLKLRISPFWGLQKLITAPAQPHATDVAVYTVLFLNQSQTQRLLKTIDKDIENETQL